MASAGLPIVASINWGGGGGGGCMNFFWEGTTLIVCHNLFFKHWVLPHNRSIQGGSLSAHLYRLIYIYIYESSTLRKTYEIKCGSTRNILRNTLGIWENLCGTTLRTIVERIGNM